MLLLYACSSNAGKLREFASSARLDAAAGSFAVEPLPGLADIPPPAEDAETYEGNATLKALYYSRFTEQFVFADDSGLEVEALNGAPGIHSARFAGAHATAAENNALLLARLAGAANRRARFVTAIALAKQNKVWHTTLGAAAGEILGEARGSLGFGYDALFLFPPLGKTFAELDEPEKFAVSARGEAFRLLLGWLRANHFPALFR